MPSSFPYSSYPPAGPPPVPPYPPDQPASFWTPRHGHRSSGFPSPEPYSHSPGHDLPYGVSLGPSSPFMGIMMHPRDLVPYGPRPDACPPLNKRPLGSPLSPHSSPRPPLPVGNPPGGSSHDGCGGGYEYAVPTTLHPLLPASPYQQVHRPQSPVRQYSTPQGSSSLQRRGKRKGLIIGCNYFGQDNPLTGCVNDARAMSRFLITRYGFREEDIVVLTDDERYPELIPTRNNMTRAMKWLVRDAQAGDSLFFHFAGHGMQQLDLDGDEPDGWDETICPTDWKSAGVILDDDMHRIMVKQLPVGCRLTAVFDCCHSGSALDLPFNYSLEDKTTGFNTLRRLSSNMQREHGSSRMRSVLVAWRATRRAKLTRTSQADVFSWAACTDSQQAAEPTGPSSSGAMSRAFIELLSQDAPYTYHSLLVAIRGFLVPPYTQKPMLSSSHPMDMNLPFTI